MPNNNSSHFEPHKPDKPDQATVRLNHPGKWLAWTEDESTLITVSDTPEGLRTSANEAGHGRFIYDWVPPAAEREAGGSIE
jgi:hypothetical protein